MRKKMIMPVVFGVLFVMVLIGYGMLFFLVPIPIFVKLVIGLIIILIAASMFYVLMQRNRELGEEEKDDLSKY